MRENNVGLFKKGGSESVALRGVEIESRVSGVLVSTRVSQRYVNDESKPIEAVYTFPIEDGVALNSLRIVLDGREIEAVAEEKDKAFDKYSDAIDDGDGAFLLERLEEDVAMMSVGNLRPGEEAIVVLEYSKVLEMVDGVVRLQIPTTVSPRYASPDVDPIKADKMNPPVSEDVPYGLRLKVIVDDARLESVVSPSHPVRIERLDGKSVVSLALDDALKSS